jgi:hypothetical protein
MNRTNWAQYTFDNIPMDHAVCLVGWDDNYLASNFTHDVYKREQDGENGWKTVVDADGKPVVDEEATTKSTPPRNGAWIVKNSWGSETDVKTDDLGNEMGRGAYGVRDAEGKATGYFYLSYYDRTIEQAETMTFSANLLGESGEFDVLQHDYMAAQFRFHTENSDDVMSSANVFDVPNDLALRSVSTRTSEENQRVTFAIYQMNDGATRPDDGQLLYRTSHNFEYAGFHRLDLELPVTVPAGSKISVVSTASTLGPDGKRTYSVSANQSFSKSTVDYMIAHNRRFVSYGTAVVNEGESFLYRDGKWVDWSEHLAGLPVLDAELPGSSLTDQLPVDNFSIKVYGEPTTAAAERVEMHRLYNPYTGEHFYTASEVERDAVAAAGWNYEGVGWVAPSEGTPVFRVYNPFAGDHHYTTSAAERDHLVSVGWNDEGVGWCSAGEDGVPLWRQYNPNAVAGAHNYTVSEAERDHLVSIGWHDEGVGWYGLE